MPPTPEQGYGVSSPAVGGPGAQHFGGCVCLWGCSCAPGAPPGGPRAPQDGVGCPGGCGQGRLSRQKPTGTGTPACSEPLPPPRAPPGGPILLQHPSGLPCPCTRTAPAKFPLPFYWCPPAKKNGDKAGDRWSPRMEGAEPRGWRRGHGKTNPRGWGQTPGGGGDSSGNGGGDTESTPPGRRGQSPSTELAPGTEGGGWGGG